MVKHYVITAALLCGLFGATQAQTEEELNKLIERAEKMAEQAKKDPRYRAGMADEEKRGFPKKDNTLLSELPTKPLPEAKVGQYLSNLLTAYKTKVPVGAVTTAQAIATNVANQADKMAATAWTAWYSNDAYTAIILALEAGSKQPGDPLLLNNIGALLTVGGAPRHALPVLVSLRFRYPNSPLVLNNVGQAYAAVGEKDSAMKYLLKCIKKSPNHPEANNTAGQIEQERGNTEQAKEHFTKSLEGSYNAGAVKGLRDISTESLTGGATRAKLPYFFEYKYKLPRQASAPADIPVVKQEHADFVAFMTDMIGAYSKIATVEDDAGQKELEAGAKSLQAELSKGVNYGKEIPNLNVLGSPLSQATLGKLADLTIHYQTVDQPAHETQMQFLRTEHELLISKYELERDGIKAEYNEKRSKYNCGEGRAADCAAIDRLSREECKKLEVLATTYQKRISAAKIEIQEAELRFLRWRFNTFAYNAYLASSNKHLANAAFYREAANYLTSLRGLVLSTYFCTARLCDGRMVEVNPKKESDTTKKMNCPIDVDVPFAAGSLVLNCQQFSFKGGKGTKFNSQNGMEAKQSTVRVAPELILDQDYDVAPLTPRPGQGTSEADASVSPSELAPLTISVDGNNKLTDASAPKTNGPTSSTGKNTPNKVAIEAGWSPEDGPLALLVKTIGRVSGK